MERSDIDNPVGYSLNVCRTFSRSCGVMIMAAGGCWRLVQKIYEDLSSLTSVREEGYDDPHSEISVEGFILPRGVLSKSWLKLMIFK